MTGEEKLAYLFFDIQINGYVFHEYLTNKSKELAKRNLTKDEKINLNTPLGKKSMDIVKRLLK